MVLNTSSSSEAPASPPPNEIDESLLITGPATPWVGPSRDDEEDEIGEAAPPPPRISKPMAPPHQFLAPAAPQPRPMANSHRYRNPPPSSFQQQQQLYQMRSRQNFTCRMENAPPPPYQPNAAMCSVNSVFTSTYSTWSSAPQAQMANMSLENVYVHQRHGLIPRAVQQQQMFQQMAQNQLTVQPPGFLDSRPSMFPITTSTQLPQHYMPPRSLEEMPTRTTLPIHLPPSATVTSSEILPELARCVEERFMPRRPEQTRFPPPSSTVTSSGITREQAPLSSGDRMIIARTEQPIRSSSTIAETSSNISIEQILNGSGDPFKTRSASTIADTSSDITIEQLLNGPGDEDNFSAREISATWTSEGPFGPSSTVTSSHAQTAQQNVPVQVPRSASDQQMLTLSSTSTVTTSSLSTLEKQPPRKKFSALFSRALKRAKTKPAEENDDKAEHIDAPQPAMYPTINANNPTSNKDSDDDITVVGSVTPEAKIVAVIKKELRAEDAMAVSIKKEFDVADEASNAPILTTFRYKQHGSLAIGNCDEVHAIIVYLLYTTKNGEEAVFHIIFLKSWERFVGLKHDAFKVMTHIKASTMGDVTTFFLPNYKGLDMLEVECPEVTSLKELDTFLQSSDDSRSMVMKMAEFERLVMHYEMAHFEPCIRTWKALYQPENRSLFDIFREKYLREKVRSVQQFWKTLNVNFGVQEGRIFPWLAIELNDAFVFVSHHHPKYQVLSRMPRFSFGQNCVVGHAWMKHKYIRIELKTRGSTASLPIVIICENANEPNVKIASCIQAKTSFIAFKKRWFDVVKPKLAGVTINCEGGSLAQNFSMNRRIITTARVKFRDDQLKFRAFLVVYLESFAATASDYLNKRSDDETEGCSCDILVFDKETLDNQAEHDWKPGTEVRMVKIGQYWKMTAGPRELNNIPSLWSDTFENAVTVVRQCLLREKMLFTRHVFLDEHCFKSDIFSMWGRGEKQTRKIEEFHPNHSKAVRFMYDLVWNANLPVGRHAAQSASGKAVSPCASPKSVGRSVSFEKTSSISGLPKPSGSSKPSNSPKRLQLKPPASPRHSQKTVGRSVSLESVKRKDDFGSSQLSTQEFIDNLLKDPAPNPSTSKPAIPSKVSQKVVGRSVFYVDSSSSSPIKDVTSDGGEESVKNFLKPSAPKRSNITLSSHDDNRKTSKNRMLRKLREKFVPCTKSARASKKPSSQGRKRKISHEDASSRSEESSPKKNTPKKLRLESSKEINPIKEGTFSFHYKKADGTLEETSQPYPNISAEMKLDCLKCQQCNKTFSTLTQFKKSCFQSCLNAGEDIARNTSFSSATVKCHMCGEILDTALSYMDHYDNHAFVENAKCSRCSKECNSIRELYGHDCSAAADEQKSAQDGGRNFGMNSNPMVEIHMDSIGTICPTKAEINPSSPAPQVPQKLGTIELQAMYEDISSSEAEDSDEIVPPLATAVEESTDNYIKQESVNLEDLRLCATPPPPPPPPPPEIVKFCVKKILKERPTVEIKYKEKAAADLALDALLSARNRITAKTILNREHDLSGILSANVSRPSHAQKRWLTPVAVVKSAQKRVFECNLCSESFPTEMGYSEHFRESHKGLKMSEGTAFKQKTPLNPPIACEKSTWLSSQAKSYFCAQCNKSMTQKELTKHLSTSNHFQITKIA